MNEDLAAAARFHGHIGPYLALGLRAGRYAIQRLGAKKHFGLRVDYYGPAKPPPSCIVDGLQLSTGATYGKRNVEIHPAEAIRIVVTAGESGKSIAMGLQSAIVQRIESRERSLEELAEEVMAEGDIERLWEIKTLED